MTAAQIEVKETALRRVRKLLALANGRGATPAEAELAMEHARRILDEHNISMVETHIKEEELVAISKQSRRARLQPYEKRIASAIARLYDCKPLHWGGTTFAFIGEKVDAEVAEEVFDHVITQVWRMSDNFLNSPLRPSGGGKQVGLSYREGIADGLANRVFKILKDRVAQVESQCRDLVVMKNVLIQRYMDTITVRKVYTSRYNANNRAHALGEQHSDRVQIGRSVTRQDRKALAN